MVRNHQRSKSREENRISINSFHVNTGSRIATVRFGKASMENCSQGPLMGSHPGKYGGEVVRGTPEQTNVFSSF